MLNCAKDNFKQNASLYTQTGWLNKKLLISNLNDYETGDIINIILTTLNEGFQKLQKDLYHGPKREGETVDLQLVKEIPTGNELSRTDGEYLGIQDMNCNMAFTIKSYVPNQYNDGVSTATYSLYIYENIKWENDRLISQPEITLHSDAVFNDPLRCVLEGCNSVLRYPLIDLHNPKTWTARNAYNSESFFEDMQQLVTACRNLGWLVQKSDAYQRNQGQFSFRKFGKRVFSF